VSEAKGVSQEIRAATVYFAKEGPGNTREALRLARARATELGIKDILVATTQGETGVLACQELQGFRVVVVSHSTGFKGPDAQEVTPENRARILEMGGEVLTATHAFGGVGRQARFGALLACFIFFGTLVIAREERTYEGSIPLVTFGAVTAAIIAVFSIASGAIILVPTFLWSIGWIGNIDSMTYKLVWWALGHGSQQINVSAHVAVWYAIAALVLGAKPLSEKVSRTAFLLYILFLQLAAIREIGEVQLAIVAIGAVEADIARIAHAILHEVKVVVILGGINFHALGQAAEHVAEHRQRIGKRQRGLRRQLLDIGLIGLELRRFLRERRRCERE